MTAREKAWEIANEFCDKSAGVYRLRNAIERAILAERERCASVAEHLNGWGNEATRASGIAGHIAKVIRDTNG